MASWQQSPYAAAQIDFSRLGQIYDSYTGAQDDALKRQAAQESLAHTRQQRGQANAQNDAMKTLAAEGFPRDAQGNPDYQAAAAKLWSIGRIDEAKELINLGSQVEDRRANRDYQNRTLSGQEAERAANEAYRNRTLGLDEKRFERESSKPIEVGGELIAPGAGGQYAPVYSGPKAGLDRAITGMMTGVGEPAPPTAQPGPMLQKQSFEGTSPLPGIQLAADAAPSAPGGSPQAPPQQTPTQEPMIDTPMGQMSADQARRLGMGLAMTGRGEAGKALLDSVQLGKTARNQVDEKELNATELLSRLNTIAGQFDPKFLTIENQLKNYGLSWADSFESLRGRVPPEQLQELARYTTFKQSSIENLNAYIKEITGAAMAVAEGERIRKGAPDPEKDSPTQFKAKLDNSVKATQLAVIRYRYLRKNGFQGQPWRGSGEDAARMLPLPQMDNILNRRATEIYNGLKASNPRAQEQQIRDAARAQLGAEFGLEI